jgi:hypothetical protein
MAFGTSTFTAGGGAVDDLFSARADRTKAKGFTLEAQNYQNAAKFSDLNARFAQTSTAIQDMQLQRKGFLAQGGISAAVGANGFLQSGSAIDLLADSTAQAALERAVAGQQGLIQEEGYHEQARNYRAMSDAALVAAQGATDASRAKQYSAGVKGVTSIATLAF